MIRLLTFAFLLLLLAPSPAQSHGVPTPREETTTDLIASLSSIELPQYRVEVAALHELRWYWRPLTHTLFPHERCGLWVPVIHPVDGRLGMPCWMEER